MYQYRDVLCKLFQVSSWNAIYGAGIDTSVLCKAAQAFRVYLQDNRYRQRTSGLDYTKRALLCMT